MFGAGPGVGIRQATGSPDGRNPRQERKWTPPPPPGLTLRQRIEKREREAGLRCWDPSCGVGPSDEDPFVEISDAARRQVRIISTDSEEAGPSDEIRYVCEHTFHPSCLVSAQRVALRGADEKIIGDTVEVSCPVCRSTGVVSKADWDEGKRAI
ncbi:hypothetical protein K435DRAFT_282089 [Dendrothele bispora CBS 962.96]|uniref:RING-type domain-containing protein n=1 Tax=Dendrothele bispora (strain CBS 962.96) TaxID=1314807 RepID=A0A4S8LM23_DENBC|nr:hypothetical protein K435DRAFT_282089 [Dendrothele bispora CBS 962.96]